MGNNQAKSNPEHKTHIERAIRHASDLPVGIGGPGLSMNSQAPGISMDTGNGSRVNKDSSVSSGGSGSGRTRKVSIQTQTDEQDNPLFEEIRKDDVERLRSLLRQKKADPNKVSPSGITPLHLAMLVGNQDTILALLGADNLHLDAQTQRDYRRDSMIINAGSNSLHILANRGKHMNESQLEHIVDVSKVLMCFIDPEQRDCKNNTPGDIARMANTVALLTALDKVLKTWKRKAAHRLEHIKETESAKEEGSVLTEEEKSQILRNKSDLMRMKLYPIMVHLMKKKVFCDSDVSYIANEFKRDKEKAARYIVEDVVAGGPYKNVKCFREALMEVSQENLAALLPERN